ncbi:hypothetical protein [Labedella endophytica]|uniref:DNA mismatch repair protein n=1 Tax=Labedella endophytica TaxID=1523160 RepID=A0A3S0VR90_9MICO|nr:hypothetical protein [Labedella endophytica]RUQ97537.1 hypothetical protein ELQ94_15285 [Labedella endophytica]
MIDTIAPVPVASISTVGSPIGRLRIDARGDRLWRVSTDSFAVVGRVERIDTAGGEVYLAKRYSSSHARFVDHGRFWSLDDALECLRAGG